MFWCLVRLSTGALCGGFYANPLEMAIQSAVACSEAKDDGLLVSRQLMERVLVWVVSFSLAVEDGFLFLLWIRVLTSTYPSGIIPCLVQNLDCCVGKVGLTYSVKVKYTAQSFPGQTQKRKTSDVHK